MVQLSFVSRPRGDATAGDARRGADGAGAEPPQGQQRGGPYQGPWLEFVYGPGWWMWNEFWDEDDSTYST